MEGYTNNKKTIEKILEGLDSTIQRLIQSIKGAPVGSLTCRTINGGCYYYQIFSDGTEKCLGKNNEDLIRALAQKKYNKELLKAAIAEQKIFKRTLKGFQTNKKYRTMNQVNAEFPESLKKYLVFDEFTDAGYIQKWSKPIPPSIAEDDEKYSGNRTMRGEIVRSKSEIIIADHLYRARIPYHYEKKLLLNDGFDVFKPDFTVLNTRTGKTYYWEHFGMMDDVEYGYKAKKKIEMYATNDIFLGKDLIATFETSQSPLCVWYVDLLIDEFLK